MHPTGFVQLTYTGVDERKAGFTAAPPIECRVRARKRKAAHLDLQRFIVERSVEISQLQKEIAHRERAHEEPKRDPLLRQQKRIFSARESGTKHGPRCGRLPNGRVCSEVRGEIVARHVHRDSILHGRTVQETIEYGRRNRRTALDHFAARLPRTRAAPGAARSATRSMPKSARAATARRRMPP